MIYLEDSYKSFVGAALDAYKDIEGSRIKIMELSDINLEPIITKEVLPVIGSLTPMYRENFIGFRGYATIEYIFNKGFDIINKATGSMTFFLYNDNVSLRCTIDDADELEEGNTIYFDAEYEK